MENNNLPNNKQAEDLDKMLADTTEESADYDTTQIVEGADKSAKTRNTRIIAGCIIGVILLALLGGLIWWHQASNKPQFSNAQRYASTQNLSNTKADEKNNKARELADLYRTKGKIDIQPYYFKPRSEMTADNKADALKRAMIAFDEGLGVMFPSKTADPNLTDDMSKAYNKDGSMNVKYTYLTKEYVAGTIYDDYHRILNPIYGGWNDFYTKGDTFNNSAKLDMLFKGDIYGMFAPNYPTEKRAHDFFECFGFRNVDKDATNKLMEKTKDYTVNVYKHGHNVKAFPVSQLTGPIKCKYSIQNTDDDWIECEAPAKMVVIKTNGVFGNDVVFRLHYTVNHDQSVSKRRILIDGIGMHINKVKNIQK